MQHPGQPVVQNASKQSFAIDGVKLSGCAPGRTRVEHFDPLLARSPGISRTLRHPMYRALAHRRQFGTRRT